MKTIMKVKMTMGKIAIGEYDNVNSHTGENNNSENDNGKYDDRKMKMD